jgi:hypothetical protein
MVVQVLLTHLLGLAVVVAVHQLQEVLQAQVQQAQEEQVQQIQLQDHQ